MEQAVKKKGTVFSLTAKFIIRQDSFFRGGGRGLRVLNQTSRFPQPLPGGMDAGDDINLRYQTPHRKYFIKTDAVFDNGGLCKNMHAA